MSIEAGAPIIAGDIAAAIAEATALRAGKTSNTTRSSTTTLTADPALAVPVEANRIYAVDAFILLTSGGTPDFKFDFTGPSGSAHAYNVVSLDRSLGQGGTTPLDVRYGEDGLAVAPPTNGTTYATQRRQIAITGVLDTAGTPGTFAFRWAQNLSDASNTIVYAGSWLRLMVVG